MGKKSQTTFDCESDKIAMFLPSKKIFFHCHNKENFAYDFYWKLATINCQIDEDFIIDNFLINLKIDSRLQEHKKKQIKAKIANLIVGALTYRIKRPPLFKREEKRITSAREIQKRLTEEPSQIVEKIAELGVASFREIRFTDEKVEFVFDEEKGDIADFHREIDYFLNDFLSLYNRNPEQLQWIIADLWKVLVSGQHSLANRYRLATNFINALRLEETRLLRERNQYELLRWHKRRYEFAKKLSDRELRESGRDWINLLADEQGEPWIDECCDREEEIASVVFDDRKHTDYLYHLEEEKQSLQKLAVWFLQRYALGTAFRLLMSIVYSKSRLQQLAVWFRQRYVHRTPLSVSKTEGITLLLLILMISISILLFLWHKWAFVWSTIVLLGLFMILGIYAAKRKLNLFRLLVPKFFLGVLIGWMTMLVSNDLLSLNKEFNGIVISVVFLLTGFYLFTEISNRLVDWRESFWRALALLGLGILQSFIIGFWLSTFMLDTDRLYPPPKLLFSIGLEFQRDLDCNNISEGLQREFANHGLTLNNGLDIKFNPEDGTWLISNKNPSDQYEIIHQKEYDIKKKDVTWRLTDNQLIRGEAKLNVYPHEKYWYKGAVKPWYRSKDKYLFPVSKKTIHFYPLFLFSATIYALFTGVILQVLWDDKPVTRPL